MTYQWQKATTPTASWSNIGGATSNTYTLVTADINYYIRVKETVSGTDSYSNVLGPVTSSAELHTTLGFDTLLIALSDEFDGAAGSLPDQNKWLSRSYTPSDHPSTIFDGWNQISLDGSGNLDMRAVNQHDGTWKCGALTGKGQYTGEYFIEGRAKVPGGAGSWVGAVWTWHAPFGAPSMEVDLAETLGFEVTKYHTTVHCPTGNPSFANDVGVTLSAGFHVFAAAIYTDHVDFYFDDTLTRTITQASTGGTWIFHAQPFVCAVDFNMGGWGGTIDSGLPDTLHMLVDYIRVYSP